MILGSRKKRPYAGDVPARRDAEVKKLPTRASLGDSGTSFTLEELCDASGCSPESVKELERFGLVHGRVAGRFTYYDEEALVVTKLARAFAAHGVEPRHLRAYRTAAEKETSLFEQLVVPLTKQRNPAARAQAAALLHELTTLGDQLHSAMMRHALKGMVELG